MKKILITDLDDTLYSWIDFYIPAFLAMLNKLSEITEIDTTTLMKEYKNVHIKYGTVERPYSTLELPCIKAKYKDYSEEEIKKILGEAFHRFNSERKNRLKLFPGVYDTLKRLNEKEIIIIGYTDSAEENGLYRLKKLGIDNYFKYIYSAESQFECPIKDLRVKYVSSKKPDKNILLKICEEENCDISQVVYVGDSITKDMYMALQAHITSVWVNYEKSENDYYKTLVEISSWTDDDFKLEQELKSMWNSNHYQPDYVINNFSELLNIFDID